jgi:hypothetical protein
MNKIANGLDADLRGYMTLDNKTKAFINLTLQSPCSRIRECIQIKAETSKEP